MNVVIAVEATPHSHKIVAQAVNRPWPSGSSFLVLHVVDPYRFVKAPISLQRAKIAAQLELEKQKTVLAEAGWKTEARVVLGHPASAICKTASSSNADLVMLGSHDPNAVTRLLLGSTAHAVLRRATCAVEIVRPEEDEKKSAAAGLKILVATDGSGYSVTALRAVAKRPWPNGSEVKLLSIPDPVIRTTMFPYFELKEVEYLNTASLEDAKRAVEAGVKILSKMGMKVSTDTPFPQDSPAKEIVKESQRWGADLIVLGSHGRRGFSRLTMGSVSEHVAFHAHCNVEVTRTRKVGWKKS
jgi:nucleotide-binding universal stress UspA family protein